MHIQTLKLNEKDIDINNNIKSYNTSITNPKLIIK